MNRKEIIQQLQDLKINFSNKSNTKRLLKKLQKSQDPEISYGVKAFRKLENGDLQSGGIGGSIYTKFEIGKIYNLNNQDPLKFCKNGFHFFNEKNACFGIDFYNDPRTVLYRIEIHGEFLEDTYKNVCRRFRILEEIIPEIDKNNNSGNDNSGNHNSGYWNSGNYNSGNYNSGNSNPGNSNSGSKNSGSDNSGYRNSGSRNSGDCNSGNLNSGNYNSGNYNSGYWNSGNLNSGSWNSGDHNSGYYNSGNGYHNKFCTEEKFFLFDIRVPKEIYNEINFNMSWFNLKNKSYKEAWKACPIKVLNLIRKIPEFKTKIAKQKFKEITGLDL